MIHVQFVAALFTFPLKEPNSKREPLTEKQLYEILAVLFGYVFLNTDEVVGFSLKAAVTEAYKTLSELVKFNVALVARGGKIKSWVDGIEKNGFLDSYGNNFIRRLLKAGKTIDEITKEIVPTAAAGTANQGQQVHHVMSLI
jgi:hypothetical protein